MIEPPSDLIFVLVLFVPNPRLAVDGRVGRGMSPFSMLPLVTLKLQVVTGDVHSRPSTQKKVREMKCECLSCLLVTNRLNGVI